MSNLNGTAPGTVGEFTLGGSTSISLADGGTRTLSYTYTPASRGLDDLATSLSFTNGKPDGTNAAHSVDFTLRGQGVAPQQQTVLLSNAGFVRIGTSGTAQIRVTNQGDGNLSGLGAVSNLRGDIALLAGSPPEFTGGTPVDLADGASQTYTYTYTPTAHGAQQATVRGDFLNGSSNGQNLAEVLDQIITGTGVGPVFASSVPPETMIDFGAVLLGASSTRTLGISNPTADPNGGDASLTDLTLLSATIGGLDADYYSVLGFTPGTVVAQGGTLNFTLRFDGNELGAQSGTVTFVTDEGAARGQAGATYTFDLGGVVIESNTAVPEPATIAFLLGGLAALARRRRARTA